MGVKPDFGLFPLGTHVFREPHQDEHELMSDLPILKRLGFNMIKIQESWAIDEPREGEIDLGRIERLINRARDLDLGVYLGLTMEQAPMWMWRKYPDCRLVYANNQLHEDPTQYLLPADGKPGPCWDHPGARAAAIRFIAELARRLGRYDNLMVWDVWQEIGFWPNDGSPLGFCYCGHTLANFRDWLKGVYGDLTVVNATWRTAFGSWDEVEPPRRATANPSFIDWRRFMDDVYLTRALEWRVKTIRENDPGQRPVFSHVAFPRLGSGAEWRWARIADFFGNSNYPAWHSFEDWDHDATKRSWHASAVNEIWYGVMLRADVCRGANGPGRAYWGAEYQGGPISTQLHLGRTPSAADMRRWMLAGLAAGMHGISFWNHRAEIFWQECNGFGLLDPLGDTTERIEEAGRIGRAVNRRWELFARGEIPRAPIAVLVNEDLYHFWQGAGPPGRQDEMVRLFSYNLRGHYARLWRLGIPVDFVEADDVAAGKLADYRAALLPMPLALDAAYFSHLRSFVEAGGLLISEACPGRFDRYGFCPRAQMVNGGEEVFGTRHRHVQIVREADGNRRWTPIERGWGEFSDVSVLHGVGSYAGQAIRTGYYLQTLSPIDGEPVLGADDAVAGVRHRLGRGTAVLLGTFAGLSATADIDPDTDAFVERLLAEEAGIVPDRCGRLLRRRRVLGEHEAWFLINPHAEAVTESVDLGSFRVAHDLLDDASPLDPARVEVEAANLRCLVVSR